MVLFAASVLMLFLVLLNLIRKQNFALLDTRSREKSLSVSTIDNITQENIGAKAPYTDRRQRIPNKTQNRFANFLHSTVIQSYIRKDTPDVTVDCIDWNSVDLSKHPLGPPTTSSEEGQINAVKEIDLLNI